MSDYEKNQSSLAAAFGYRTPGEIVEGSIPKGQKPDVGSVQGGYSEDLATRAGRGASQLAEWVGASKGVQKALDKGAYGATSALPFSEAIWQALHGDMTGASISASLDAAGGKPGALAMTALSNALIKTINKHPDLMGIFIPGGMGEKGMTPQQVRDFQEFIAKGGSRQEAWEKFQATPVGQRIQNKWHVTPAREIDDSKATLSTIPAYDVDYDLEDILDHPELFKETEGMLSGYKVRFAELPGTTRGMVLGDQITINKNLIEQGDFEQARSTLLHEVQHAVQDRSLWGQGGSRGFLTQMDEGLRKEVGAAKAQLETLNKSISERIGKDKASALFQALAEGKGNKKAQEAAKELGAVRFNELKKLYQKWKTSRDLALENLPEGYGRLFGEWQARMVQSRLNMSEAERMAKEPIAAFVDPMRVGKQGETGDLLLRRGSSLSKESTKKTLGDK